MQDLCEYVYYTEVYLDKELYKAKIFRNRDQAYLWGTENASTYGEIRITEYKVI